MKPFSILLFMIISLMTILGIAIAFPVEGVAVTNNLTVKFHWDYHSLFQTDSVSYADISEIIAQNNIPDSSNTLKPDSISIAAFDTVRANSAGLRAHIQPIEFAPGDSTGLQKFFANLDKCDQQLIRILHYGDSQIEGDRITGFLRNLFQQRFGGSGPGLMPAIPGNAESASIIHKASGNWIGHSVYYPKDTILPHHQFGILGSFARFTSYHDDTIGKFSSPQNAWIEFNRSSMAFESVQNFTQCNVFYGHVNEPFVVRGFVNDSLTWFEEIDTAQQTRQFQWDFSSAPDRFRIEFEGNKSPDVYAITLDAPTGVAVDNLPFRGSAGTEFVRLDNQQLSQMYRYLPAGLVIFEFGVNVVTYNSKNYHFYQENLARQLRFFKRMMPGASILVVGVSDMSDKNGNSYISKPAVTKVVEAQRQAAFSEGCAFWDLYSAMGGNNSMPSWVFAKPPLAQKDFTHFNRTGGHIVAQMLFNSLMAEYIKHCQTIALIKK
jgi:hypothetical protein